MSIRFFAALQACLLQRGYPEAWGWPGVTRPHRRGRASRLCVNGHEGFPVGGQVVSPWAVGCCPRGRPWGFPKGGRVFPRSFGQGLHPLSVECVFESDRFALGDDDVGVVEEPVNEGAGDRFVHELVEA
ncbi:hypothetical protein BN381_500024 [Candidatus Microthrix parvicella RN1]|uniref:Uncharacterized protein n=1 Tax=Candidatus Neomicrothrix parvicella RN1 TaxID=1229780 RepID=R4Z668_9ACTN|nr:hypothetical protein BN381_500024 [Candidatus Microthrix parvicella RN1]